MNRSALCRRHRTCRYTLWGSTQVGGRAPWEQCIVILRRVSSAEAQVIHEAMGLHFVSARRLLCCH